MSPVALTLTYAVRMSSSAAGRTPREPLSRERVLRAGVALADERGIEGLSMRKLASHLGFEPMSLYNHVDSKDDLVEGMVDLVGAEVDQPPTGIDWKTGLRQVATSMHEMLLRHHWAAALLPHHFPGTNRWRTAETILQLLTEGGFTGHLRDLGYHAVTLHIGGFTQQQLSYAATAEESAEAYERFHREVSAAEYPLMVDHVRYHAEMDRIPGERPDEFQFVLELILDGLERARDRG